MNQSQMKNMRKALLMSKAELSRKTGLSVATIDRLESGMPCRQETRRKIMEALGVKVQDWPKMFPGE